MDFLDRLTELSKRKGLKNNMQLSKASGVPYTTIDGFFRVGYDNAKLSTLQKLANTLDCSLEYLVNGTPDAIDSAPATPEEMQTLILPYRALDTPGKRLINTVLRDQLTRIDQYGRND